MERRPSPHLLKITLGLALALALITATIRSDPGGLADQFSFRWPITRQVSGAQCVTVAANTPTASTVSVPTPGG